MIEIYTLFLFDLIFWVLSFIFTGFKLQVLVAGLMLSCDELYLGLLIFGSRIVPRKGNAPTNLLSG